MSQRVTSAAKQRQMGSSGLPASGRPGPGRSQSSGRPHWALLLGGVALGCSAANADPGPEPEIPIRLAASLHGCNGKASSTIPASGHYVLTTFGGKGESQPLACGGSTKNGSWYYAASRQRYGCGARIRVRANGQCVVVETDDYGPDVCVEKAVGMSVLDASPLVAKALFGTTSLGWSDEKEVTVDAASASTPLGPCADPSGNGGASSGGSGGASGAPSTGGTGGGGTAGSPAAAECASDGACNPGNDGSGMICVNGQCVPGCHSNAQCPGITTCQNGQCS